ncbi:MAG: LLM class flavin-dependent oxidoreductase [Chloroflexi bacterium]|nr:MAG: LLM class flavin-dependent oxidoreductase [Chloroflexota bacterium]
MRFGVMLPSYIRPTRDTILGVARAAERLGFDSVWTNSHTVVPASFKPRYPYSEDGLPSWNAETAWADAMTTLGFVAAATERVRLGVAVVPLIITDPITLAKQSATVDLLSNGRFELGVGAGWLLEEGKALGHPTDNRRARLEETLDVLRLAWTRPTFSYDGRFVKIPEVGVHPQPPQGDRLPIWIGGQGDEAIRIAAKHGAGLFIWLQTPERVADYGRKLRALRSDAPLAACVWTSQEERLWDGQVRAMAEAGVDLMVIGRRYDDRQIGEIERFAKEFL